VQTGGQSQADRFHRRGYFTYKARCSDASLIGLEARMTKLVSIEGEIWVILKIAGISAAGCYPQGLGCHSTRASRRIPVLFFYAQRWQPKEYCRLIKLTHYRNLPYVTGEPTSEAPPGEQASLRTALLRNFAKVYQICGRDTYPIYGTKPPERRFYLIFQVLTSPQLDYRGKAWALLETFPWVLRLIETQRI